MLDSSRTSFPSRHAPHCCCCCRSCHHHCHAIVAVNALLRSRRPAALPPRCSLLLRCRCRRRCAAIVAALLPCCLRCSASAAAVVPLRCCPLPCSPADFVVMAPPPPPCRRLRTAVATPLPRGNKFNLFREGTNIWEEICQTLLNF